MAVVSDRTPPLVALYDKTKRHVFTTPEQFCREALKREKVGIYAIERILPPLDTGGEMECLFFDSFRRMCAATITEAGEIIEYHIGW